MGAKRCAPTLNLTRLLFLISWRVGSGGLFVIFLRDCNCCFPTHMRLSRSNQLILNIKLQILSLRGGKTSRAKRPPQKSIGEERLLSISRHPDNCSEPTPNQIHSDNLLTNLTPTIDSKNSSFGSDAKMLEEPRSIPEPAPAAPLSADELELAQLRASVMQRLASLFPAGVNITAIALGDERSAASSFAALQRAIAQMLDQLEATEDGHAPPATDANSSSSPSSSSSVAAAAG